MFKVINRQFLTLRARYMFRRGVLIRLDLLDDLGGYTKDARSKLQLKLGLFKESLFNYGIFI